MHAKRGPAATAGGLWKLLLRPGGLRAAGAVLALVAVIVAGQRAWVAWGRPALDGPAYHVAPERITVTPQPQWITVNVKGEVIRDGHLADLRLLDPQLTEKVSRAFAVHTWVARVTQVAKRYPAELLVELEYRRPVAAVEVPHRGQGGLYFVDAQSVLLPSEDFSASQAKNYLRIQAEGASPAGAYGAPWGDARVASGARLADALRDRWGAWGVYRIVALGPPAAATGPMMAAPLFELQTRQGKRVLWGHAPGEESPDEPPLAQKLQQLEQWVMDKGPLDREEAPDEVRLWESGGL